MPSQQSTLCEKESNCAEDVLAFSGFVVREPTTKAKGCDDSVFKMN